MITKYQELIVYQKSFQTSLLIYQITKSFPKEELYCLVSQMRRSAISIPSNIAEGYCRSRKKEFMQFLLIAYGSGAELETQLMISKELGYLDSIKFNEIYDILQEVMKMLNSLIGKIKTSI